MAQELPKIGAMEQRERELAILAAISTRLHGEEDVQAILDGTLDALLGGLSLETAWLFLEDEKDGRLRLAAHRGVSPAYVEEARDHLRARGPQLRDGPEHAGPRLDIPAEGDDSVHAGSNPAMREAPNRTAVWCFGIPVSCFLPACPA